jgi:ketosteroid isomerase-like protein
MDHEQHVRETWAALSRGDLETVEAAFAANGRWRAVEDGEWNCENRTQILNVMRENRARRVLEGDVEEVLDVGKRVVVAFRPARHDPEGMAARQRHQVRRAESRQRPRYGDEGLLGPPGRGRLRIHLIA